MESFQDFASSKPGLAQSPSREIPRPEIRSTASIAAALAKAQSKIEPPARNKTVKVRTRTGEQYSFDYADYAAIVAAVRGPLSENGIAWTHLTEHSASGFRLVTKLIHESGEELVGTYPLPATADAKDLGGAMTYGKRYTLSNLTGCAADDDLDAEPENVTGHQFRSIAALNAAERRDLPAPGPNAATNSKSALVTEPQLRRLFAISTENRWTEAQLKEYLSFRFKHESTKALTRAEYDELVDTVSQKTFVQAMTQSTRIQIGAKPSA